MVNDCGEPACGIYLSQDGFQLNQGNNATLSVSLANFNGGGPYTLSLHRFEDDEHTISMSVPAFLNIPSDVSVAGNGMVTFDISAISPQPDGEQTNWANVILRAEGPTLCEAAFDVDITPSKVCDVDWDGDIDRNDVNAIFAARNTRAAAGDPRDANGDGLITINDGRQCVLQCTNPKCAP